MYFCSFCKFVNMYVCLDGGLEGGFMFFVYLWIGGIWVFVLKFGFCYFCLWYYVILKILEFILVENWIW